MKTYLDAALEGKNDWWRYLTGYFLIIFSYLVFGSIPIIILGIFVTLDANHLTNLLPTGEFTGIHPMVSFSAIMFSFIPFLLATSLIVIFIHRRKLRTLITPAPRVDWKRLFLGLGVWMVIGAILALAEAVLYPGRYVFTPDLRAYLPVAVVAICLIPLQTSAEEFFFRGYILQHAGLKIKNILVLSFLSGFLFTLPHLANPEVADQGVWMLLLYFSIGAFMAVITLRDNGLELALGLHAGNNLFSALFASYSNDVFQTPVLFTVTELDMTYNLITLFLGMLVFYILLFKVWPKKVAPLEDAPLAAGK